MPNALGVKAGVGAVLCVTALVIAGCGTKSDKGGDGSAATTGSTAASAPATPTTQPKEITIKGFNYAVATAVRPGAQITVVNNDSAEHTVTADSAGGFDIDVGANSQATFTAPKEPGSYPFHCTYHPNMRGNLVVVQAE